MIDLLPPEDPDPVKRRPRCPWCDIYVRSTAGLCICDDPCGSNTCPMRNADSYTPPPVPRFK